MLGTIATLKVKPGMEKEFEAVAKELVAKVNANEPGLQVTDVGGHHADPVTVVTGEVGGDEVLGDEVGLGVGAAAGLHERADVPPQGVGRGPHRLTPLPSGAAPRAGRP